MTIARSSPKPVVSGTEFVAAFPALARALAALGEAVAAKRATESALNAPMPPNEAKPSGLH